MNLENFNKERQELNKLMSDEDSFFSQFGKLDDSVYSNGTIPKKYKELIGLAISIVSKCNECVLYHLQECIKVKANKQEIIEAIKMSVIGGGSVTYPTARFAFKKMKELEIVE